MPALPNVVFAQVDAFGKKPTWNSTYNSWNIFSNTDTTAGNRTAAEEEITRINLKVSVNIPVGYHGILWPHGDAAVDSGDPDVRVMACLIEGTGVAQTIIAPVTALGVAAVGDGVLTSGTQVAYLSIIKAEEFNPIMSGF